MTTMILDSFELRSLSVLGSGFSSSLIILHILLDVRSTLYGGLQKICNFFSKVGMIRTVVYKNL